MALGLRKKTKTCRVCGTRYPVTDFHESFRNWCSPECAVVLARQKQAKAKAKAAAARRADTRRRKERLKTNSQLTMEAQSAVNAYVRIRDSGRRCISCGRDRLDRFGGHFDAGHYRSTGSAPHLRFHLLNIWAQCKQCNHALSGNAVEYRKGLIGRIGLERVEAIEADQTVKQYRADDLRRIKKLFNRRANQYWKRRNARGVR